MSKVKYFNIRPVNTSTTNRIDGLVRVINDLDMGYSVEVDIKRFTLNMTKGDEINRVSFNEVSQVRLFLEGLVFYAINL